MNYQDIDINEIDNQDRLFYLRHKSTAVKIGNAESMPYNPIWVQKVNKNQFRIVDGFLIVEQLTKDSTSQKIVPALVFPEDYNITKLWKKRTHKRFIEDNLSIIGFYEGLDLLLENCNLTEFPAVLKPIFIDLNIKESQLSRQKLKAIISKSKSFKNFTDISSLGYYDIDTLVTFNKNELNDLNVLFGELKLKGKKLTSILNTINDLRKGYTICLNDLTTDKNITKIIEEIPLHLRYKHIKQYLESLRYPRLNDLLNQWKSNLNRIKLPQSIKMVHDTFFEADEIQVIIKSGSIEDLKTDIKEFSEKMKTSEFKQLFNLI